MEYLVIVRLWVKGENKQEAIRKAEKMMLHPKAISEGYYPDSSIEVYDADVP